MENTKTMSIDDVLNVIRDLSYSQGFYGRMYRAIIELRENDIDGYKHFCEVIENQGVKNPVDVVLFFET